MKHASSQTLGNPHKEKLRAGYRSEGEMNLDICIDSARLKYLLKQRLLLAEDFRCLDSHTKRRVKKLLINSLRRTI